MTSVDRDPHPAPSSVPYIAQPRQYDEWDPYVPPYNPYEPGASVIDDGATSSPMTETVIDDADP